MKAVIDTNVLLVAEGMHADVSHACMATCVKRLLDMQKRGVVVIDDGFRILGEYLNKTDTQHGKMPGTVFLKWLLNNQANQSRVHRVRITESSSGCFNEFPDSSLQNRFDPPDRKFVAVANAHPDKPSIWQAVDCKWLDWGQELLAHGITVEFVCLNDIQSFYKKKFPGKQLPLTSLKNAL